MITLYIEGKTQFFHIQNTQISERISEVGDAIFEIPARTPDGRVRENITAENLQEMNRIQLTKTENNTETVVFEGFIHTVEATWDTIKVTARSLLGLLEYRILKSGLDFRGSNGTNIIAECAKATGSTELFTFEANIPENLKKKYEIGRSMLDVLKDISSAGYDFILNKNTVKIGEIAGKNLTKTVQYTRELTNPRGANITDIVATKSVENIANFVMTKIASSPPYSVKNDESIAKFGRIERYITVNADEVITPSKYLDKHKNGSTEYQFRPIEQNYTRVNVGDIVSVSIAGIHPLLQFVGPVKITEKSYRDSDLPEVTIAVSTGETKNKTLFGALQDFEARIGNLERKE